MSIFVICSALAENKSSTLLSTSAISNFLKLLDFSMQMPNNRREMLRVLDIPSILRTIREEKLSSIFNSTISDTESDSHVDLFRQILSSLLEHVFVVEDRDDEEMNESDISMSYDAVCSIVEELYSTFLST